MPGQPGSPGIYELDGDNLKLCTTTYGKGLVQEVTPLPDGAAIKLTTARYLPPSGHDLDRVGLTPDVPVDEPVNAQRGAAGADAQLDAALARLAPNGG